VTLEVHLPQKVGRGLLKARMGPAAARRWNDPAVPPQDVVHRRAHRTSKPLALKTAHDLARTPGRMGVADHQHLSLDGRRAALRARVRPPRLIGKPFTGDCTRQPLVSSRRMDTKPAEQLTPVRPILQREPHELTSLVHLRHLLPRHGRPSSKAQSMQECVGDVPGHLSGMSPGHTLVPAIHVFLCCQDVDARHEAGHDGVCFPQSGNRSSLAARAITAPRSTGPRPRRSSPCRRLRAAWWPA